MGKFISSFFDNESAFGQIMNRCGILIGANIMFVIFILPVVTIGPSLAALYYVMLKTLRGDGSVNPFKTFWQGFKMNFKQGLIVNLAVIALVLLGYLDLRFCNYAGGVFTYFKYAIYVLGIVAAVLCIFLFPVMAAFSDTIPHLLRNAIFFASKNPFRLLVLAFFNMFPLYLTYTDTQMMPLYGFIWVTFGYAAIAMLGSSMLLPDFAKYLPKVNAYGEFVEEGEEEEASALPAPEKKEKDILNDMKKMGM